MMKRKVKLSTSMTLTQFENGYWYTTELKDFAKTIGIPFASTLRKDELEHCIKLLLKTGKIESPNKRSFTTYGDLVREYVRLNQTKGSFAQVPHDRYINFLSDFLKAEEGATRDQALKAWKELKTLDAPKNYRSWKKFQSLKEK